MTAMTLQPPSRLLLVVRRQRRTLAIDLAMLVVAPAIAFTTVLLGLAGALPW